MTRSGRMPGGAIGSPPPQGSWLDRPAPHERAAAKDSAWRLARVQPDLGPSASAVTAGRSSISWTLQLCAPAPCLAAMTNLPVFSQAVALVHRSTRSPACTDPLAHARNRHLA